MLIKLRIILGFLLITTLFTSAEPSSLAQTQNSVGGGANGAQVNITANVLGATANVSVPQLAPVTLPPQGGSATNQVASAFAELSAPGVLTTLSTGLIVNSTSGNVSSSAAHAESTSTVNGVNILNGLVTATTIRSKSTSDSNGATASSTGAGSFANQLRIAGTLYEQSEFEPNTTVSVNANVVANVNGLPVVVPVSGTVIINEQIGSGNGATTSSLSVNFLHVSVSGAVAGTISLNADIVVASASSSANFTAGTPLPPNNHAPSLSVPGPQTVQAGSTLTFNVSATDPDGGDTVSLSATNLPPNSNFAPNPATGNPASGQFSFTPSSSQAGHIFTINFTATDNHGASTSGSVRVSVTAGASENHPPVISVPGPQTVEAGDTLTFTVTANDPDGDSVTLSASAVPPHASFNPANGTFTFTPTNDQSGHSFVVTFTATDSKGASASAPVQITVVVSGPNEKPGPPVISVPPSPVIIAVGNKLDFTVTGASPAAGCAITLSAKELPVNATFDPATGKFSFTPTVDQKDKTLLVTFTATDCVGQTATGSVSIIVVEGATGGIGAKGQICIPVTKVFFEPTPVNGGCGFITITLFNRGSGNLRINSINLVEGSHFRIEGISATPLVLQSAGVLQLKLMFEPKAKGTLRDTIIISTDDPDQPIITIELKAKGR
ncbi:MAG TPA: choice-of-anchor P family protein [Blastocatellia bacterium]|nr:choice-of-anchor P family protein [Blastocatellia bacterium]